AFRRYSGRAFRYRHARGPLEHRNAFRLQPGFARRAGAPPEAAGAPARLPGAVGARAAHRFDPLLPGVDGQPAGRDLATVHRVAGARACDLLFLQPAPQRIRARAASRLAPETLGLARRSATRARTRTRRGTYVNPRPVHRPPAQGGAPPSPRGGRSSRDFAGDFPLERLAEGKNRQLDQRAPEGALPLHELPE